MTGNDLKQSLDNCKNDCTNCQLYRPNAKFKCVKEFVKAWQNWGVKQSEKFGETLGKRTNGSN